MLHVSSPQNALSIIQEHFFGLRTTSECLPLADSVGRVLCSDILAPDDVPGFNRSTVDGYAVQAADTFGCSDSIPALLTLVDSVEMGAAAAVPCNSGQCVYVPTGGQLPPLSDAVVMIEHVESYGSSTFGILNSVAPGQNCIYKGDDVKAGQPVLRSGTLLRAHDIGALAAMGYENVPVAKRPVIGILSTGDELVPIGKTPGMGEIRDVNTHLLAAASETAGGTAHIYESCPDDFSLLEKAVAKMAAHCDVLLLSGGTSVGAKDSAPKVIGSLGSIYLHGIAIKPGKPTLAGEIGGKPIFGLPGHPAAAYFIFRLFVEPLIRSMLGRLPEIPLCYSAKLASAIPSNHGREECVAVRLFETDDCIFAQPIIGKSGLITLLSGAGGYIRIPRDREGIPADEIVSVLPF